MAEEKLCPMLQKPCIRDACKMWLSVTLSGTDPAGKAVSSNPPEQCSFVWMGLLGLKEMQFSGRGAPRRPARPATPAPGTVS